MDKVCFDGSVAIGGQGVILEKYDLSDESYTKIMHSISKEYLLVNDSIIKKKLSFDQIENWKNTPIKGKNIILHEYILKILEKYNDCITKSEYNNVALGDSSHYCILHIEEYSMFRMYMLNDINKTMYVIEETW